MVNKFERNISKIIALFILLLFILTIAGRYVDIWFMSLIWYVLFLASWFMMPFFGIEVLLNKKARTFSIITAIVTGLAFMVLSVHGLSAIGMFIRAIPSNIIFNNSIFIKYSQLIFYSSLIVVYFLHMINAVSLKEKEPEEKEMTEEEIREIRDKKLDEIIAEIEANKEENKEINDGLTDEDYEILNVHILEDSSEDDKITESENHE